MVKDMSFGNGFNYAMKRLPTFKKKAVGHDLYQNTTVTFESKKDKKKRV